MKREHAIRAHWILDILKRKSPGVYEDILKLLSLSDAAFEEMMGNLQKDMCKKPRRSRKTIVEEKSR